MKRMEETARRDRMREAILRSAARAFRRDGFHGASTRQIADDLGMTKGSLYYYFRDKEQILFLCHDRSLDLMLRSLDEVERSELEPEGQLRLLIRRHVEVMIDELGGSAMALDFGSLSPPLLRRVVAKRDAYEKGFRRIVARGAAAGRFRRVEPKIVALAILGSINWVARWYRPEGAMTSAEVGAAFAEYFVNGLLPATPAPRAAEAEGRERP